MKHLSQLPEDRRVLLYWSELPPATVGLAPMLELLSEVEVERARRLQVELPRRSHIVAHAMLRSILGELTGAPPAELRFRLGEHGKPHLQSPAANLGFNLSHSGTTVTIAVARGAQLGVDVEELRARSNAERLARRFFSAAEAAHVAACSGDRRQRAFFHLWTIKEAYLKAVGSGITVPLHRVEADPDPDRPLRLLRLGDDRDAPADWSLLRAELANGAMCTVAIPGHGWQLQIRQWRLDDSRV